VIPDVLLLRRIARKEWPDLFDDIQIMEAEALALFREMNDKK
jgi:hypothetical protein